jgi:membrane protein DedA with SNARE-associated domain
MYGDDEQIEPIAASVLLAFLAMPIEQLISAHGYVVILIGTFLEGETVLVVGGFLAHQGYLELPWVIAAAFIGTLVSDQLFFFLGRKKGLPYLSKRPTWQAKAGRVFGLLRKYRVWIILGFRFLYGFRTVTPFLIGSSGFAPVRFVVLNVIGAGVWAVVFGVLGYLLGSTLELFLKEIKRYELRIVLTIIMVGVAFWLVHLYMERKNRTHNLPPQ